MSRADEWIARHLDMDLEEILRLKHLAGITDMFMDAYFQWRRNLLKQKRRRCHSASEPFVRFHIAFISAGVYHHHQA